MFYQYHESNIGFLFICQHTWHLHSCGLLHWWWTGLPLPYGLVWLLTIIQHERISASTTWQLYCVVNGKSCVPSLTDIKCQCFKRWGSQINIFHQNYISEKIKIRTQTTSRGPVFKVLSFNVWISLLNEKKMLLNVFHEYPGVNITNNHKRKLQKI